MKTFGIILLALSMTATAQKKPKVVQSGAGGDFYEINRFDLPNYDSTCFVYHTLDGKEYRVYRDKRSRKNKYFYFKENNIQSRKKRIRH